MIGLAFGGNHLDSLTLVQKAMQACSQRLRTAQLSTVHQTKALGEGGRDFFFMTKDVLTIQLKWLFACVNGFQLDLTPRIGGHPRPLR